LPPVPRSIIRIRDIYSESVLTRLYLVRHAHSDPGDPDSLRPLSARGREQARELGELLGAVEPDAVLASPLLRARETAAAIAKAAGVDLRVDDRLAPGATTEDVLAAVEGAGATIVVVCHQPDCSEIALTLGAGDREFAPAGFAEIELP
jgi:phosphohistidine phosphatase SixA